MVVDPIQSVEGKAVIDAFRLINPQVMMLGQEPGQTTSDVGHLNKPSIQVGSINGVYRMYFLQLLSNLLLLLLYAGFDPWIEERLLLN